MKTLSPYFNFICVLTAICLAGCEKGIVTNGDCDMLPGRTCVAYQETYCADPWPGGQTDDVQLIASLDAFLDAMDIDLVGITIAVTGPPQACNACSCQTGRSIHGAVRNEDLEVIEAIGFIPQ